MGSRKRIGIYFTSGDNWLGGVYYLINLVNSFNFSNLSEQNLPLFVIFYNEQSEKFIKLFSYKDIEFIHLPSINARTAFLKSLLTRKNAFLPKEVLGSKIDVLYPFNDFPALTKTDIKLISWYPDLQHKFYPEYFTRFKLWQRELRLKFLLKRSRNLVLSSKDVLAHFVVHYSMKGIETAVLPFVSLTGAEKLLAKAIVRKKYKIEDNYFLVSNQFYKHKDHKTLFEALALLRKKGEKVTVVLTGLMEDYRDPEYIDQLKKIISDNKLEDSIHLLGVIPRLDQLSLMKNAIAVIQPSLFEGWSTVIEDAKSLGARIIASDIEIHKEQLANQGALYENRNPNDLADKLVRIVKNEKIAATNFQYAQHIKEFPESFMKIVDNAK